MTDAQILRMRDVVSLTKISRSRIYVAMGRATDPFPRPLRLGPNSVGWKKSEIVAWLDSRARAGRSAGS